MRLNIGNFKTIYSIRTIQKPHTYVCFERLMESLGLYREPFPINVWVLNQTHNDFQNHNFIIKRRQMNKWMDLIASVYPFTYKIHKTTLYEEPAYRVHINIKGNYVQILFVLTAIRYFYEYPFNVLLYDAFKLKKLDKFKKYDLINLCSYVIHCIFNDRIFNSDHSLTRNPKYTPLSIMQKKILYASCVHDVIYRQTEFKYIYNFDKRIFTSEFWEKGFVSRLEIYKYNINWFNK